MPIYEYSFGVYVEADDEQAAWEQVRSVSEALDKIDAEGDSATDGPFLVEEGSQRGRECEHKWREYEKIGIVCRDCGEDAPDKVKERWGE
jgi:hypothetical protein